MTGPRALRDQVAALPPERQALVRQMLAERGLLDLIAAEPGDADVAAARQRIADWQAARWAEYARSPEPGAWHTAVDVEVTGPVDTGRLAEALAWCADRWEITRTRVPAGPGAPAGPADPGAAGPGAAGPRFGPGDLPVRAEITPCGQDSTRLLICGHDLAVDRASVRLLAAAALGRHEGIPAGAAALQLCELRARQAMPEAAERQDAALRRQDELLSGVTPAGPVRAGPSWAGRRHPVADLAGAELAGVRALARDCAAAPFAVFLAAWALAAGQLSGCRPPVIGCCLDGRAEPEAAGVIGPLAHPALIVTDVTGGGLTFEGLVRHAAGRAGACYRDGAAALRPTPGGPASRLPASIGTGVTIGVQEDAGDVLRAGRLQGRMRDVFGGFAKESLRLEVSTGPETATAVIEYRTGDYQADEVAALGADWLSILRRGIAEPRARVARLTPRWPW